MTTWDDAITTTQNLASDSTAASLVIFKRLLNLGYKLVLSELGRSITEKTTTPTDIVTVASQQNYPLPMDCLFPKSIAITVGGLKHPVIECEDQDTWNALNMQNQYSDIPEFFFVKSNFGVGGSTVDLYPIPSSASNPIIIVYESTDKDLSADAYTAGTVTFTNGDATILGNGTTFTSAMVGRYIYCSVDGWWYRIVTFTDTTHVEIERDWVGTTTAGLTTNIREIFGLPEEMQILPVYFALAHHFAIKKDAKQETKYWNLYVGGINSGKIRWGTKARSSVIRSVGGFNSNRWAPAFFPTTMS